MLSATPLLRSAASFARINIKRNIGVSYVALKPAAAAIDPIQKLFAEKVSNSMFETIFTILCLNFCRATITPMIINCTYTCEF